MKTLIMRPYVGETDLQAIAHLINTCEAIDQLNRGTSVPELQQGFDAPSLLKARDLQLWEDADGKLIGFGQLWIPEKGQAIDGLLWFHVHPAERGQGLEKQIFTWGEERMREVGRERHLPVQMRLFIRDSQTEYIALSENCGFSCDRYFFTMERSLTVPIPEPQFPAGFTLHQVRGEQDAQAWVDLHNHSFIDHWNHHDLTVESYKHWLIDPQYRPELDLVAVAADSTFAAFCQCRINSEENKRSGRNEGSIGIIGTRRGFRRMGLGRAMLLAGMQRLKAAGVETAKLGVDVKNPNQAKSLYESVGFRKLYANFFYVKDVQP